MHQITLLILIFPSLTFPLKIWWKPTWKTTTFALGTFATASCIIAHHYGINWQKSRDWFFGDQKKHATKGADQEQVTACYQGVPQTPSPITPEAPAPLPITPNTVITPALAKTVISQKNLNTTLNEKQEVTHNSFKKVRKTQSPLRGVMNQPQPTVSIMQEIPPLLSPEKQSLKTTISTFNDLFTQTSNLFTELEREVSIATRRSVTTTKDEVSKVLQLNKERITSIITESDFDKEDAKSILKKLKFAFNITKTNLPCIQEEIGRRAISSSNKQRARDQAEELQELCDKFSNLEKEL
jgi:hypothetical protein